jgi:hypothetical protein
LFQVGKLVWKIVLPLGTKDIKFGKWSPSWEGPYKIIKVIAKKIIHDGVTSRYALAKSFEWPIF